MNKTTITSLKFSALKAKFTGYFSIFAIVLASTFGSFNAANAANVGNGATHSSATATAYDFNTATKDLDINTSVVMTVNVGAITDTAITGDVDIVTANNASGGGAAAAAATITIASITMDAGTTPGVVTIKDADDEAGALTVNVTGDLITDGTFTVTTLEDTDDELTTVDVGGTVTITGATEIVAGGSGVTGDILVNLSGAAVTFTGGIDLADISTTGSSTLMLDGAVAQTITGAIDGDGAGEGTLKIDNTSTGGATFATAVGATALKGVDISESDSTATFNSTVVATTITNTGTATFSGQVTATNINVETTGTATFTGKIVETDSSTSELDLAGAATATVGFGHTTAGSANTVDLLDLDTTSVLILDDTITNAMFVFGTATTTSAENIAGGSKIYMPVNLSNGQTVNLTKTDGGGDVDTAVNLALQDTALITYDSAEAGATVTVTATEATTSTVATNLSVTTNDAKALSQAYAAAINDTVADASAEDAFRDGLNALNGYSATEDTALAQQVAPQTDLISGSTIAAQAVTGSVQGIMSNRMASLRSGDAYFGTGVAAGGMSAQSGFIQVFGSSADQKSTTVGSGTQAGYDSESTGVAIGFDGVTDNGMTVGLSLATANTDVDGKGTGKSTNSIDTYSASLYMDMATDSGYVEGSITYGINENTSSRKVTSAGLSRTYNGSYDSTSISANISVGSPSEVGNGYVTPFGSLTLTNMDTDAYTETSTVANDALRLKVDQGDVTSTVGTVGIKYHTEMSNGGTPMISLALNNELGDNTIDTTNTYQGGGTPFKTSTAVEELSATLGLGYSYGSDSTSIEFAYEADVNDDDYLSHYGSIKIVGKF